ncbi:putative multiple sugar transport system substrate-binding protein [Propionispira arboris]|uniref:Putative multiple sugar transport system substrate-binding protein n=1 Tax=Propionispira arboris TaxID=84035 RepID=A0A1H7BZM1_9FIRM|nr:MULTISPECIES: multiple monosaccharide ABC transporter substrate-binding protein [Propionispira]SEJ82474.1 putative multiple sugar transport system substrate-binding protein [Propionispira arboris]
MSIKKILVFCLAAMVAVVMTGCGGQKDTSSSSGGSDKQIKVGVSMPTKSLQRWNQDGSNMEAKLKEKGYDVDLQFAENKVEMQVSQIENMITKGAKVIIVGAIDGGALSSVLDEAKSAGVQVIAYDRLIMNTDAVSYYATFDNYGVGKIQGEYIETKLGLKEGKGPYNFEIATGPLDDNNVVFFFKGAMDILQPYIDQGKLVVKSGQKTREQCATPNWDEAKAQERMDNIITSHYTSDKIDAVLCSNDSVSLGVQSALKSAGYGAGKAMPVITGQDANISNVKAILAGEQSMSVFKDTRALADQVVKMVEAIVNGKEPEVNDTKTYNNGKKVVPSYLLQPQFVDMSNYKKLLIESGYYKESDL